MLCLLTVSAMNTGMHSLFEVLGFGWNFFGWVSWMPTISEFPI